MAATMLTGTTSIARLLGRSCASASNTSKSRIASTAVCPAVYRRLATTRSYATITENGGTSNPPTIPVTTFESPFAKPPDRSEEMVRMRTYKPRTPGLRHLRRPVNDHLWKGRPYLPLTIPKKGHGLGGRNNSGRVTVRHRGGGHKRRIRTVDFNRWKPGPHIVDRIEYDPNRSAHIALVTSSETGIKSYILAADGLREGDKVQSYRSGVPDDLLATMGGVIDPVHAVGTIVSGPAKFCRAAGTYATVIAKDEARGFAIVRLQSGEVRRFMIDAPATVGVVSNPTWRHRQLGKAGRSRWLGIRPTVRGVAMNACDHPHGGGRGKSKGNRHPVSPWGFPTKSGYKTRKVGKKNPWVVTARPRGKEKKEKKL
ncbi:54S ribosomal protein RML2 [Drechslerella dactyloides]|uniref:Large ribosomal subunit protein uL2m n=1 Tax=Drechslerella dactyloides TaxID=74499 RepID=A0AAD6NI40_DREDA|nr:54S ribosomal protein RML2 [Drechslerella dactyloides]